MKVLYFKQDIRALNSLLLESIQHVLYVSIPVDFVSDVSDGLVVFILVVIDVSAYEQPNVCVSIWHKQFHL